LEQLDHLFGLFAIQGWVANVTWAGLWAAFETGTISGWQTREGRCHLQKIDRKQPIGNVTKGQLDIVILNIRLVQTHNLDFAAYTTYMDALMRIYNVDEPKPRDRPTVMCCHRTGKEIRDKKRDVFSLHMDDHLMDGEPYINELFASLDPILTEERPYNSLNREGIPLDSAFLGALLSPFYYVDNV